MKNNLKLIISFFVLSLITLVSSVFAWVNISKITNSKGPGGNIGDYTNLVTFEVQRLSRPDLGYEEIVDNLDMMRVFGETRPGEEYSFRIKIINTTVHSFDFYAELVNISNYTNEGGNPSYDIRDVFYIKDGIVSINNNDYPLTPNDQTVETKFGQTLNEFRLANLIVNNNIGLNVPYTVDAETQLALEFTLVYDASTEDIGYQNNQLRFDGIYLYGQ